MSLDQHLQTRLAERQAGHRYRTRALLNSAQGPEVTLGEQRLLNFCSNDYLGLANHPKVIEATQRAAGEFGVGSGASHLVCGHTRLHHQLEEALAAFTGRERALLFSTGFMANSGVITALLGRKDSIIEDKLNHASLLDAGLASGAEFLRYRHNDVAHCAQRLSKAAGQHKLLVTDGVFSMDGDLAPMPELAASAAQHDAWLMMDDAHGFGCLGATGAGTAEHFGLGVSEVPILMATLGKALGVYGAFVAGSEALVESLIQFARPYIYTTAMPPSVAAAALQALELVQAEPWRREQLQQNIRRLRDGLKGLGLELMPSDTAIQPVLVGPDHAAMQLAKALSQRGVWVSAIRPPTVPEGTARLRITLSAAHTPEHIDTLIEAMHQCAQVLTLHEH